MVDFDQKDFGNIKGVMLCNRPNENMPMFEEQFSSQIKILISKGISFQELLPLNNQGQIPLKRLNKQKIERVSQKQFFSLKNLNKKIVINESLKRHKEWLNAYKSRVAESRNQQQLQDELEKEKFKKVREMAARDREKTKKLKADYLELKKKIMTDLEIQSKEKQALQPKTVKLTSQNVAKLAAQSEEQNQEFSEKNFHQQQQENNQIEQKRIIDNISQSQKPKKALKEKPKWAQTEKQIEEQENKECDELLNFATNLDYEKYIDDLEIQTLMKSLKDRINSLAEEGSYEQMEEQLKQKREKERDEQIKRMMKKIQKAENNTEDNQSQLRSEKTAKTVTSIRSEIEEKIKEKNKEKDERESQWDKSITSKPAGSNIEGRIAKQVADEILKTYKHLGNVHSNMSLRKLLEKEAKNQLAQTQGLAGPKITVSKNIDLQSSALDPSNLPYLHRNPAV